MNANDECFNHFILDLGVSIDHFLFNSESYDNSTVHRKMVETLQSKASVTVAAAPISFKLCSDYICQHRPRFNKGISKVLPQFYKL